MSLEYVPGGEGEYVRAGVGYHISSNPEDSDESYSAGKRAAENSIEFMKRKFDLRDVDPNDLTLTMVFSSTRYKLEQMLKGVRSITENCPLIGCTTAGEITTQGVHDDSVSVFILSSELIAAGTGIGEDVEEDAKKVGMTAASDALERLTEFISRRESSILRITQVIDPVEMIRFIPYSIIMLPPGMSTAAGNILYTRDDPVIEGLREKVGFWTPIIGGSSGDGGEVRMSYQFCNDRVYKNSVVCAILLNFVNVGFSTELPFVPTEKTTVVTKLKDFYPHRYTPFRVKKRGFAIQELDGIPAAIKYFELLQGKIKETDFGEWLNRIGDKLIPVGYDKTGNPIPERKYPLGLYDLSGKMWARIPTYIRKEDKSIEFSSPIPEEVILTLMETPKEDTKTLLCENVKKAVEKAIRNADISRKEDIAAVILFNCCIHRSMGIGISASQFNTIKEIVGEDTPLIGFYTYGEQLSTLFAAPSRVEQSTTVMVISKRSSIGGGSE